MHIKAYIKIDIDEKSYGCDFNTLYPTNDYL